MDSQFKLLSELLSDQAAFITSPNTSLANYWGGALPPCPPVSTGLIRKSILERNGGGGMLVHTLILGQRSTALSLVGL